MKTTTRHNSNGTLRTDGAAMAGGLEYLGQFLAEGSTVGSTFGEHQAFANRSRPVSSPWCDRLIPGTPASLIG